MKLLFILGIFFAGFNSYAAVSTCDADSMKDQITANLADVTQRTMEKLEIAVDWSTLKIEKRPSPLRKEAMFLVTFKTLKGSLMSVENYWGETDFRSPEIGLGLDYEYERSTNGAIKTTDVGVFLEFKIVIERDAEQIPIAKKCVVRSLKNNNWDSSPLAFVNNSQDKLYLWEKSYSSDQHDVAQSILPELEEEMPLN